MNWSGIVAMVIVVCIAAFVAYSMYVGKQEEEERLSKKKPPCPACGGSGFSQTGTKST